ncbi:MAG: hypothetical protein ACJ79C_15800, partial [Myxococcales bacterium]
MKGTTAVAFAAALCIAAAALASPNVPLDDPLYAALERLRAEGRIPPWSGGMLPLTRAEMERLFLQAKDAVDA